MTAPGRSTWVDDELFPFESRFVTLDGHTVHFVDEGSGPTLLFLHGNPTWSCDYRDVIHALRDEFRCVALDCPGFGLSSAGPGYRYLPEEHAAVVVDFLDRLANTWAWPLNGDLIVELASRIMGGPIGRALIRRFNLFVNAMIPVGHRLRKLTPDEMAHYRNALATHDRREASAVFPRRITASRDFLAGIEAELADLASLPTLIVWGNSDFAFRTKERRHWEQIFADHHTVIVEGAGHFVQSDAPGEFAAAIRGWWSARDGRRTSSVWEDVRRKMPRQP